MKDNHKLAVELIKTARDAAWESAERIARERLIERRRFLPQFVGGWTR